MAIYPHCDDLRRFMLLIYGEYSVINKSIYFSK